MYANLAVTVFAPDMYGRDPAQYFAHEVEQTTDELVIHIDGNDGDSSHSEPAGKARFPRGTPFSVSADF